MLQSTQIATMQMNLYLQPYNEQIRKSLSVVLDIFYKKFQYILIRCYRV